MSATIAEPSRQFANKVAVRNASKPVIAIKPLAAGQIAGNQAFEYVYEIVELDSCMVGIGWEEELDTDLKAERVWVHSSRRLNRGAVEHLPCFKKGRMSYENLTRQSPYD